MARYLLLLCSALSALLTPSVLIGSDEQSVAKYLAPRPASDSDQVVFHGQPWMSSYKEAYRTADTSNKKLLIYFRNRSKNEKQDRFEQMCLADPNIQKRLQSYVLLTVFEDYTFIDETGRTLKLTDNDCFKDLDGHEGIAIVDFSSQKKEIRGTTVIVLPLEMTTPSDNYLGTATIKLYEPATLASVLDLPEGTRDAHIEAFSKLPAYQGTLNSDYWVPNPDKLKLSDEEVAAIAALNILRSKRGLRILTVEKRLVDHSRLHAKEMEKRGFFASIGPGVAQVIDGGARSGTEFVEASAQLPSTAQYLFNPTLTTVGVGCSGRNWTATFGNTGGTLGSPVPLNRRH